MLIYFLLAVSGFESYISTNSQNLHVTAEGFLKRFFGLDKDLHVQLWIQGQWRDENISARLFYDTQQRGFLTNYQWNSTVMFQVRMVVEF